MKNDSSASNDNSSTNSNTNEETNNNIDYEALMEELNDVNLAIDLVSIALAATVIKLEYLYNQKVRILDKLNNTNFSENLPDLTDAPKLANKLLLFVSGITLGENWDDFQEKISVDKEKVDEKELYKSKTNLIASILILIATDITDSILALQT